MLKEMVKLNREREIDVEFVEMSRNFLHTIDEDIDTIPIDPQLAIKMKGDFFGLLNLFSVPVELYQVTLDINNLFSSEDFDGSATEIKLIKEKYIADLLNRMV